MEKSDTELVAAARAGDKAAFGQLVERYDGMVRRITYRMLHHAGLAQELAQEAFLQAYLSLDQLHDAERFGSWLYGIALNVCRGHIRQQKMDFYSLESLMGGMRLDAALLAAGPPNPEQVVEARELHHLVLEAVKALSPRNRDATLLFYYEGLTTQEVAATLNVPVTTVKVRLHRSREQLRSRLSELFPQFSRVAAVEERRGKMIQVTVADVVRDQEEAALYSSYTVVILLDEAGMRALPIWIGPFEGEMIAVQLTERPLPRPLTFTFVANLLNTAGVELEAVEINALRETTFYATARIRAGEQVREVDCRPSDGINLALHMGKPIYVAEAVMETAGIDTPAEGELWQRRGLEQFRQRWEARQREQEEQQRAAAEKPSEEERAAALQKLVDFVFGKAS